MADISPLYPGRQVKMNVTFSSLPRYFKAKEVRKRTVIKLILCFFMNSGGRNVVEGKYLLFLYHNIKMLWL